jgi:hypothetical protein
MCSVPEVTYFSKKPPAKIVQTFSNPPTQQHSTLLRRVGSEPKRADGEGR